MQVATAIIVTITASNALLNSGSVGVGEADADKVGLGDADAVLTYTFPVSAAVKPLFVILNSKY